MWKQSACCRLTVSQTRKPRHNHQFKSLTTCGALVIAFALVASSIPSCHGFFFPKSFFRKANENPAPPPQQHPRVLPGGHNGHYYGTEPLQGSGTDVQPALRIVNRPPPGRNIDQNQEPSGPAPGSNFHVPKELCMACERFPWMPVAGAERHVAASVSSAQSRPPPQQQLQQQQVQQQPQQQQQQYPRQNYDAGPTKTIVINALGEAQGPVPIPPVIPSRRPFAIQFDGNQSGNKVNNNYIEPQQKPPQQPPPVNNAPVAAQNSQPQQKPDKPVTFQIYQAQSPNQQQNVFQPQPHPIGLYPPPMQSGVPQHGYGRPTVLQPAPPPQFPVNRPPIIPPPNPMAVGTIIASQQNTGPLPEFQKVEPAKLVYQEHFTQQGNSPPPAPQNFKVPIIPHPNPTDIKQPSDGYGSNSIVQPVHQQQQNYGGPPPPPPQPQQQDNGGYRQIFLQMRPPAPYQVPQPMPRPSPNMKPPAPVIHYGKPIRIPTNIGPQRPSGQVFFPPPQAFLQMSPPPPPSNVPPPNGLYGLPQHNTLDSGIRPQDERRPSPSGQVLNIQLPVQQQQQQQQLQQYQQQPQQNKNFPPQQFNGNSIQPVPIPVPTTIQDTNSGQESNNGNRAPSAPTFTQETGWEIIPSIQTDLTHLFNSEKGKQNQQKELPVPVPIPVPQSHPPKAPLFIVAGGNQQEQNAPIKVQDVTYHEEGRNPIPSGSSQSNTLTEGAPSQQIKEQQQNTVVQGNVHLPGESQQQNYKPGPSQPPLLPPPQQIQVLRPRPFILGVPTGPARPVIFRPRPPQQYEPLHPSIMTALNHAQQTSLLTHQYLSQSNVGQPFRENTIYVSPAALPANVVASQLQHLKQVSNSVAPTGSDSNTVTQEEQKPTQFNQAIDPRIPNRPATTGPGDQGNVNCKHLHGQHLIPITTHQKQQQLLDSESSKNAETDPQQEIGEDVTSVDASISSSSVTSPGKEKTGKLVEAPYSTNDHENESEDASVNSLVAKPTSASYESTSTTTLASSSQPAGIRGQITVQDNGNKGSYLIYYPRQVTKSPVYWVQPSRPVSQGVVRLAPQISPVSPSIASTMVSWSRPRVVMANQFRTEHHFPPTRPSPVSQEGRVEETYDEREEVSEVGRDQIASEQVSSAAAEEDDENIPYGQKLGVTRDNNKSPTPYDIISVSGSDDEAQSLEEADSTAHGNDAKESSADSEKEYNSEFTSSGNDESVNLNTGTSPEFLEETHEQLRNEHNLQNVQETKESTRDNSDDADDERDDFGLRPQTIFRKPISTTVIHSPGSSSFQSLKLPNFKPHRVIVHDFTSHSANAAATGPSAAASETQGVFESSESVRSQSTQSPPRSVWSNLAPTKNKATRLVDNGGEEESSESVQQPQGFNIQEVIASGAVTNADCVTTTHMGHLHTSYSTTTSSPRIVEPHGLTGGKGRDIFLPLGSRFPGGRPSIFSAVRRPLSSQIITIPTTSTTLPTTTTTASTDRTREAIIQSQNGNKKDRYFGQSPSGFAASIPVPVYRRPSIIQHGSVESLGREEHTVSSLHGTDGVTYVRPQSNIILSAEDIYKNSEVQEENNGVDQDSMLKLLETTTTLASFPSSVETETADTLDEIMSTEKSSSFSVSVVDDKGGFSNNGEERASSVKKNGLQQDVKPFKVIHVTSVPVVTESDKATTTPGSSTPADGGTSTTALPLPASTSTKIVKTVRVRQRMRSGSFNGPLRTRFHGPGRVRVVQRPANQEYIRHFPEFATQEGDKLAKEEEQEVKNALIELKKSTESGKAH